MEFGPRGHASAKRKDETEVSAAKRSKVCTGAFARLHPCGIPLKEESDGEAETVQDTEDIVQSVQFSGQDKGMVFLSKPEREKLVTMPDCLLSEIGLRFPHDLGLKARVIHFFERYTQQNQHRDHYVQTRNFSDGRGTWYRSELVTPSLDGRVFVGQNQTSRGKAEESAYQAFFQDPQVITITEWIPPPARKVRRWVNCQLRGWKGDLIARDINVSLVVEEAKQELFSQLRDRGCRLAQWDGNA